MSDRRPPLPTAPRAPSRAILAGLLALALGPLALAGAAVGAPQLQQVVTGLSNPVYVTSARDGTNRLFILEQGGMIKVLRPGAPGPTVFLASRTVVLSGGERGLLGLAFHPQFTTNRRFFVNYTRKTDGATTPR